MALESVREHTDHKGANGSIPLNLELPALPSGQVPPWLEALGVKPSQYLTLSKLPFHRAVKWKCIGREGRFLLCLWLHSFGFRQELAVKMVDGKKVPLRPDDVCKFTGVHRKHFSEVFNKLEQRGLAKCEGSTKDQCLLYAWAVPRPVQEPSKLSPSTGTIFSNCPQQLAKILKRYRLSLPELSPSAGTISELEELARAAHEAELSLRMAVNCHRKQHSSNKEEIKVKKREGEAVVDSSDLVKPKEHTRTHTPSVSVEETPKPEPTNGVCAPASFEQTRETEKPKSPKAPAFDPKPFWETFWATYSQTKDARRQDAWEWWRDNVKSVEYAAEILDGLNRHIASDQWQRKIGLPDAINFLLKHRYKERPLPASAVAPPQTKSARQAEALAQFAAKIREQPS